MSDVLFGQSYYLRFDPKLWAAMQPYPPLGTLYAASSLRARGYEVALFDAMLAGSEGEWAGALDRVQPRFAVIYEDNFNYLSKMCLLRMRQAAFRMIGLAREHGCTVVVSGSDASDRASLYLSHGAHFVLTGEGEITLGELVDRLCDRTDVPLGSIRGMTFPAANRDALVVTPPRPDVTELDDLPLPAWDLVDVERYREVWSARHGYFSMNMATSRGCPYHCNWCAKPIWGQRYHVRSPESVVSELKWLKETYQPDHIWFVDDILGLRPGWLQQFADRVEASGVRTPFKSLCRVDLLLRGDTVAALQRAGAEIVWVGAESGSQKILDAMDKGTSVEQTREAVRRLRAAGIKVGFFLQFGYPGETRADIAATLQLVRDCRPDDIGMSVSYPLPGTKFYHAVREQLGLQQNWVDSGDLAMMYRGPFTTAFYRTLHGVLHHEFRMRRAWARLTGATSRAAGVAADRPGGPGGWLRLLASVLYHATALPLSRIQLELRARSHHRGLASLPRFMTAEAAAQPTPERNPQLARVGSPHDGP